jgi:cell division protein FtsB
VRLRRALGPLLVTLAFVGILFIGIFPTRTYLTQREATHAATERLEVLGEENQVLEARVRQLKSDAEIERLAREQYNLVRPGEEAYALLPPPATTPAPDDPDAGEHPAGELAAPPEGADGTETGRNVLQRVWDGISSLL